MQHTDMYNLNQPEMDDTFSTQPLNDNARSTESTAKQNLENLSKSILEYASGIEADTSFLSFQAALEYVFKLAERERVILVIDEYPYVARSSKSLASTLKLLIDKNKDTSKLMLILCGSSMSHMEDQVLAYKAPLYGRCTAQMKLLPFDFEETCRYFSHFKGEDKALAYGIVGGLRNTCCKSTTV